MTVGADDLALFDLRFDDRPVIGTAQSADVSALVSQMVEVEDSWVVCPAINAGVRGGGIFGFGDVVGLAATTDGQGD